MLSIVSMFPVEETYLKLIENGLDVVYCSNTGTPIGTLSTEELFRAINLEFDLNPVAEPEDILDNIQLALIPVSSRPSVLFQNMSQERYLMLAKQHPELLFRFLAGKFMFERWTHIHGLVKTGDKVEWLKTLTLAGIDTNRFQICLDTLIRIDAVFSVRQVTIDSDLTQQVLSMREEWPGFDKFDSFIYDLESNNIQKLKAFDPLNEGRKQGNTLAVSAMLDSISNYGNEEYAAALKLRQHGETLRQMAAQNRSGDEMRKIKRDFAKNISSGETQIKRGLDAAMSLAMLGDTFNKDLALKLIAGYDSAAAANKRQRIASGKYNPLKIKSESTGAKNAGTVAAAVNRVTAKYGKVEMNIDFDNMEF